MFCEKTRNAAAVAVVLAFLPVGSVAWGQTLAQVTRRNLSNYAIIIVGYHVDGRCQDLKKRQRADYRQHMRAIRHAPKKKSFSSYLLTLMVDNAQAAGHRQFTACNRKIAEMVKPIGLLTASLGKGMAHWVIKNTPLQNNNGITLLRSGTAHCCVATPL